MPSFQEIVVYVLLALALFFLWRKFFGKKKNDKNCGDGDCGCN
nr:FeoB-associated Cys-rich membrane protein [uncultured Flavobacterium sp.]